MGSTIQVKFPLPGRSLALGVVLIVEAFISPVVWWGAFILGILFSDADQRGSGGPLWLDAMGRLGNRGVLLVAAVLVGAAVVVLARPATFLPFATGVCLAAGPLN
jgi:hypothetical protein